MDQSLPLARRAAAEGIATFALVFAGCGAIVTDAHYHGALGAVGVGVGVGVGAARAPSARQPRSPSAAPSASMRCSAERSRALP